LFGEEDLKDDPFYERGQMMTIEQKGDGVGKGDESMGGKGGRSAIPNAKKKRGLSDGRRTT